MQPLPQQAHHGIEPVALSCEPVDIRRGCGRCADRNDMLVDDSGDEETLCVVVVLRSAELPPPGPTGTGFGPALVLSELRRKLKRRFEMVAVAGALDCCAVAFDCCPAFRLDASAFGVGILLRRCPVCLVSGCCCCDAVFVDCSGGASLGDVQSDRIGVVGVVEAGNGPGARIIQGNFGFGGLSGLGGSMGFQPAAGGTGD